MIAAALLFLSLGLDTLAVAAGLGLSGLPRAQWRRVGLTFAFFEGVMPIAGLVVGSRLSDVAGRWAVYGAAALLIFVGAREIRESFVDDDDDGKALSVEWGALIATGLSISLDELAVGFSLGALHVSVGPALGYIAAQAFALTFVGLSCGRRIGKRFGERAELLGGVALLLLGLTLLVRQMVAPRA